MKKYYYDFMDWGLYDIDEVEVLAEHVQDDFAKKHPDWDFDLIQYGPNPTYKDNANKKAHVCHSCLFDTEEEANEYAKKHSSCFGW